MTNVAFAYELAFAHLRLVFEEDTCAQRILGTIRLQSQIQMHKHEIPRRYFQHEIRKIVVLLMSISQRRKTTDTFRTIVCSVTDSVRH